MSSLSDKPLDQAFQIIRENRHWIDSAMITMMGGPSEINLTLEARLIRIEREEDHG